MGKETNLALLPVAELAPLLAKKKLSPVELVEAALARVEQLNPRLNAYITIVAESARDDARRVEKEIARGKYRGPLHGIPIALKDNIYTRGIRTTAGSKILADFVPAEDATVARRLHRAGAILLGKTNLHEFAYGVTTDNPHYGPARNPWDPARTPGGSSGGSATAIATGMCCASIGTDTGGSIRIPAALCGIVGLKPTYGRVSVHGVVPLSRTLDHVGPLARTVTDAAIVLAAIAGRDPLDSATASASAFRWSPPRTKGKRPLQGIRLGWPREFFFDQIDDEVMRAIEAAARDCEKLGATVEEISLPHIHEANDPGTHIALAEAQQFHERSGWYPARAADYGEDVRKRLEIGANVRAVDYLQALETQKVVRKDFEEAFTRVDAILTPTVPVAAPRIGEKVVTIGDTEEPVRAALLRLNRPSNFTGMPAISIPCGFTKAGLPIGLQITGPALEEAALLRIALAYEQAHHWHRWKPVLPE